MLRQLAGLNGAPSVWAAGSPQLMPRLLGLSGSLTPRLAVTDTVTPGRSLVIPTRALHFAPLLNVMFTPMFKFVLAPLLMLTPTPTPTLTLVLGCRRALWVVQPVRWHGGPLPLPRTHRAQAGQPGPRQLTRFHGPD